jgi:hypothetical protein
MLTLRKNTYVKLRNDVTLGYVNLLGVNLWGIWRELNDG